jgi:hypothetical protein
MAALLHEQCPTILTRRPFLNPNGSCDCLTKLEIRIWSLNMNVYSQFPLPKLLCGNQTVDTRDFGKLSFSTYSFVIFFR